MKRNLYVWAIAALITVFISLPGISQIRAQTAAGTDFWLTFGKNLNRTTVDVDLQIRIVGGDLRTKGTIYFTELDTAVSFTIPPQNIFTYTLNNTEKRAVYNTTMGTSTLSAHIATDYPVTVYALNQSLATTDATNIFPETTLGADYYQISYTSDGIRLDAYAVVATKDSTSVRQGGTILATLNTGQVYYETSATDMTGTHITTNHPVAFFALHQGPLIPGGVQYADCLMQQLAPVSAWGKTFFVPVSHLATDVVRIVASQNGTSITQTGGTLKYSSSGSYTINAGQFIELELTLSNNGCYIQANKPVGVCSYLTGAVHNGSGSSDPAQCWLPAIDQTITETLITPFIPTGKTNIDAHYALIATPTATKDSTKVSIGGASPVSLSNENWRDNTAAGISFCTLPLSNKTASYRFTNNEGLIIIGYGIGQIESYYYLAGVVPHERDAAFYANDIHYVELPEYALCTPHVNFKAEVSGLNTNSESLKWYIDGVEETAAQDKLEWSKSFPAGKYKIALWVRFTGDSTTTIASTLYRGAVVSTFASPPECGSVVGSGCYKIDDHAQLEAITSSCYRFVNWTIDGKNVSTNTIYSLKVEKDVTVVANFYALDFDTYAPMLWNNTFMLNLRRLKEEGYRIIGCEWYKNGDLEPDTRTIDEFSYSAGPKKTNLLEPAPTWYMFKLLTTSHGPLCSTHKTVEYHPFYATPDRDLTVYPNPALSGNTFTVEGVAEGSTILVYNQYGICVSSVVATENPATLTLNNLQPGMYLIRASGKQMKVVVR